MRASPDLVVVGDAMIDVATSAEELARGGDVHGTVRVRLGGTAANAAVWAAAAGASVRLHARVGDDDAGRLIQLALTDRGVEPALIVGAGERTGAMLVVVEEGERSMVADRGANAGLTQADLPAELTAGAVLVSGYTLLHAPTRAAGVEALSRARAEHVAVDAASWPLLRSEGPGRFLEAAGAASILLANEREATTLGGEPAEDAARRLGERFEIVVVKRGARGATVYRGGELTDVPSPEITERDGTGAGDAFDGVLLAGLTRGEELPEAARAACEAGARAASSDETWPER